MKSLEKSIIGKSQIDKVSVYGILYTCSTIRYLLPGFIADTVALYHPILDNFLLVLSFTAMGILIIKSRKIIHPSILLFVIPFVSLFFSTVINHANLHNAIVRAITTFIFLIVIDDAVSSREKMDSFLHVVRNITWFFFVANLIAMAAGISGAIDLTVRPALPLYGNINSVIRQILPGLCCSCIIDSKNNRKLSFITALFFIGMFYFFSQVYFSNTSFVALIFIIVWILAKKIIIKNVKGIYAFLLIFSFFFEIIIVIMQNPTVSGWITELFHRSLNFTDRGLYWKNAWLAFLEKPIFGYGLQSPEDIEKVIGAWYGSCNYFLDTLYQGGIIYLIPTLLILIFPVIVMKNRRKLSDSAYVLTGFCSTIILMFLVEVFAQEYYVYPLFYALILLMNSKNN